MVVNVNHSIEIDCRYSHAPTSGWKNCLTDTRHRNINIYIWNAVFACLWNDRDWNVRKAMRECMCIWVYRRRRRWRTSMCVVLVQSDARSHTHTRVWKPSVSASKTALPNIMCMCDVCACLCVLKHDRITITIIMNKWYCNGRPHMENTLNWWT